jgi:hypothetical protein
VPYNAAPAQKKFDAMSPPFSTDNTSYPRHTRRKHRGSSPKPFTYRTKPYPRHGPTPNDCVVTDDEKKPGVTTINNNVKISDVFRYPESNICSKNEGTISTPNTDDPSSLSETSKDDLSVDLEHSHSSYPLRNNEEEILPDRKETFDHLAL